MIGQIVEVINAYGAKRIVTDIVLRYLFADKAKGPNAAAVAVAARDAEYVLDSIQDLMIASDPYLVGRVVGFSDLLLSPIVAYFTQFREGPRAPPKLPKLAHWCLAHAAASPRRRRICSALGRCARLPPQIGHNSGY